jgi:hypothetical protein
MTRRNDVVKLRIKIAAATGGHAVELWRAVSQAEANHWITYWSNTLNTPPRDGAIVVSRVVCTVE